MDKIRIYIVDDNAVARTILNRLLTAQEDFEVVGEIGSGQGSIIMLDELNPDVVLLEMNVTGGMKVTDVVREMKNINPAVKVILCVEGHTPPDEVAAAARQADDFISKPFRPINVVRTIRECVNR